MAKTRSRGNTLTDAEIFVSPKTVTTIDRIVLGMRQFIAAAIFFNTQAAEKIGLGLTDLQMIHMLQLYGPSTPSRLATWTGLSSGGVTVALDRLEKAGYIVRKANPDDRRSLLVTLVPSRMRKLVDMYRNVDRESRRLLAKLPESDLEAVVRFFETLANAQTNRQPVSSGLERERRARQ